MCAFIASTRLSFANRSLAIATIHGVLAFVSFSLTQGLVLFFPIYSYVYIWKKGDKFNLKFYKEKRNAFVEDLKEVKDIDSLRRRLRVQYYYPLFLIKRIVFSAVLVYCRDYPIS